MLALLVDDPFYLEANTRSLSRFIPPGFLDLVEAATISAGLKLAKDCV